MNVAVKRLIAVGLTALACFSYTCAGTGTEGLLGRAVDFYRGPLGHLSAVKESRCPMYPSCSTYSLNSIEKHGPLLGWLMTADRLFRCGRDELERSSWIRVHGEWRCYDPVSHNDFWWYQPEGE